MIAALIVVATRPNNVIAPIVTREAKTPDRAVLKTSNVAERSIEILDILRFFLAGLEAHLGVVNLGPATEAP